MTLKIESWSPKVDTVEILCEGTINLKLKILNARQKMHPVTLKIESEVEGAEILS